MEQMAVSRNSFEGNPSQVPALSQELLDRAHAGWERFSSSFEESSDD